MNTGKSFFEEFDNNKPEDRLLVSKARIITWATIRDAVVKEDFRKAKVKFFFIGMIFGSLISTAAYVIYIVMIGGK